MRDIYIEYSKFEEQYGSTKHMMSVLDRGLNVLPSHQKYEYLLYYIHKSEEYYGVTKSRELYERGLEILDNENVKDLGMKFIDMEIKLGEVDRARGIYIYVSQVCNPKTVLSFWNSWREFEVYFYVVCSDRLDEIWQPRHDHRDVPYQEIGEYKIWPSIVRFFTVIL